MHWIGKDWSNFDEKSSRYFPPRQRSSPVVGRSPLVAHFSWPVSVELKANHRVLVGAEEDDRKRLAGYSEEDCRWMKMR